jgi:GNAT superfamily N-acetyltransferase
MRRAVASDVPAIVALLADDDLGASREDTGDQALGAYLEAYLRIEADPTQLLAVAQIGDQVVGTLQLTFIPGLSRQGRSFALIQAVRIEAARRSQGLGAQMIGWAEDRSREQGCAYIELLTNNARLDAQRFYARLGYAASHVGMRRSL